MLDYLDRYFLPAGEVAGLGTAYIGRYDPSLVLLSIVIASLASFGALSISRRVAASTGRLARYSWVAAGAVCMGFGIWSMHFIGMLAFSLPCGISYDPWITLISILPGVAASGVALNLISKRTASSQTELILGAVFMGGGIGAMHYMGMAAVSLPALLRYDTKIVVVSVVVAVALAYLSLGVSRIPYLRTQLKEYSTPVSAIIMGLGIAGMHYTAMDASLFFPDSNLTNVMTAIDPTVLAWVITALAVLVAAIGMAVAFAGNQFETAKRLKEEISQREVLEQEAQSGRARLQAILDSVVDAIITATSDGFIQQWSPAAERLFGYSAEEAVGANLSLLMPEPHKSQHDGYMERYSRTGDARVIGTGREVVGLRKNGSTFPAELSISKVATGEAVLFTGVVRDISERKRAEEELVLARRQADEANQSKSIFLANMSHEVRTPLNAIMGMAHLVAKTELVPRQRDYIRKIQQSSRHLLGVVNDILDYSKVEAGQLRVEQTEFDIEDVLLSVSDVISEKASSKGLELVFDVGADVRMRVIGDPLRLGQVLINFANNAVKFTERGEINLVLRQSGETADSVEVTFSVKDTGIGLSIEQQSRLFQSFQQADAATTRRFGGTGLGLAISKRLAELMGGRVGVVSELGNGSIFWLSIWLGKGKGRKQILLPKSSLRGRRMLVVDDNANARAVISEMLQSMSFSVDAVNNGQAAVDAVRSAVDQERPYEVAFVDWRMPDIDGLEAIRRIRGLDCGTSSTAFVLVTAYGREEVLRQAEQASLADILLKPVNPSMLFDAAMRALGAETAEFARVPEVEGQAEGEMRGLQGLQVLLAEDNEMNQEVASQILASFGVEVDVVGNGAEAIARLGVRSYDLVLMDVQMPVMDGLEATRRIRRDAAFKDLPIIAMTANAMKTDRQACLDAGMNEHISKPIDVDGVYSVLEAWTRGAGGRRQRPSPKESVDGDRVVRIENDRELQSFAGLIDIRAGLSRAFGRRDFFLSLLRNFAASQADVVERTQHLISIGQLVEAERHIHTTKGVAAQIGATKVTEAADRLETSLREKSSSEVIGAGMEALRVALAPLIRTISDLTPLPPKITPPSAPVSEDLAVLQKILGLLGDSDPEARVLWMDHAPRFEAFMRKKAYTDIANAIGAFDFDSAHELLARETQGQPRVEVRSDP